MGSGRTWLGVLEAVDYCSRSTYCMLLLLLLLLLLCWIARGTSRQLLGKLGRGHVAKWDIV